MAVTIVPTPQGDTLQFLETGGGGGGGSADYGVVQGRITLQTGVPIMTTTQSAQTTLYFTPYKGNQIGLYSGTAWAVVSFAETSLSLAGLTANSNYDIWAYNNAGTVTLEALIWTNNTTRATALAKQDGVYVKTGDTTRRYLGTIRINSTGGQCNFTFGSAASKGGAGDFGLWNYYNRVDFGTFVQDTDNSWTHVSDSTWRASNSSNTFRVSAVVGVREDSYEAVYQVLMNAGNAGAIGIGINSTTSFSGNNTYVYAATQTVIANLSSTLPEGYNYISALTYSTGGTSTYYGDNGVAYYLSGLTIKGTY